MKTQIRCTGFCWERQRLPAPLHLLLPKGIPSDPLCYLLPSFLGLCGLRWLLVSSSWNALWTQGSADEGLGLAPLSSPHRHLRSSGRVNTVTLVNSPGSVSLAHSLGSSAKVQAIIWCSGFFQILFFTRYPELLLGHSAGADCRPFTTREAGMSLCLGPAGWPTAPLWSLGLCCSLLVDTYFLYPSFLWLYVIRWGLGVVQCALPCSKRQRGYKLCICLLVGSVA